MMTDHLNDELFDSLLKAAIIQNSLNELNTYPPDEEIGKLVVSDDCDQKIRTYIRKQRRTQHLHQLLKSTRKLASVISIILGLSFMALLSSKDVRAACYHAIIKVYEKYIQFDFTRTDAKTSPEIEFRYIPAGFTETLNEVTPSELHIMFENSEEDYISFFHSNDVSITVDNEHYDISDATINGTRGKLFVSKDPRFPNIIVWHNATGSYELICTLDDKELLKIAENISCRPSIRSRS